MELAKRKNMRLQDYDYSQNGAYFVTICSYEKKCIFGNVITNDEFAVVHNDVKTVVGQGFYSCRLWH